MIDPLFKSLEVLRQVYPEGVTLLVAPEDYDRDKQWLFVLTDATAPISFSEGFDPLLQYRFFTAGTGKGYAFRTGQEALTFARDTAAHFDMQRLEEQINTKLARLHSTNNKDNKLIESVFPNKDMKEVYGKVSQDTVKRTRLVINKLKEKGVHIEMPTTLSIVKEDDT